MVFQDIYDVNIGCMAEGVGSSKLLFTRDTHYGSEYSLHVVRFRYVYIVQEVGASLIGHGDEAIIFTLKL